MVYNMKKLIFFFASVILGQQLQITAPKTQVYPGEQIVLTYSLSGTSNIAAFQWDGPNILKARQFDLL
jgi:hypothetical protein